jgi:hypothetical protein
MRYLHSGGSFDFASPQTEDVSIEDVAFALASIPRFGGHLPERYSVAQHSLFVAEIVSAELGRPDLEREGLLHDSAECYTGDIIRPLKQLLSTHCDVLRMVELTVACALGFTCPAPAIVKQADTIALAAEVRRFFPDRPQIEGGLKHVNVDRVLAPGRAEQAFLDAYERLSRSRRAA